jgi:light-harvesting complex I chlorophyll a/b binding protein 1
MALSLRSSVASKATTSRGFLGKKVVAPKNVCKASMKSGNWLPGAATPEWLPDSMPGNTGFDPLALGKDKANLMRFQEAELLNGRWAMMGAAGVIGVEVLGYGNWMDGPKWAMASAAVDAKATYFGVEVPFNLATLAAIEFLLFAFVEAKRSEETDQVKKCYPGGSFDPLGFSKDSVKLEEYKLKELANSRLAMMACLGFECQYEATGKGPIANLAEHVAAPMTVNFGTNGVSVPWF